jgi:hypothetical protein
MAQAQTFTIEKFLGVNKSATETLLQPGEASDMVNWMITDDMKLQKTYGYVSLFESLGSRINGLWYGSLSGTAHFLFACGGHVYEHDLSTGDNTDLGTLEDVYPTTFWVTNNTVYIMDGEELYKWTGTGNIETVQGYVPTVLTASPPTGGGTILEGINYLTGTKIQKFSADGDANVYQLAGLNIDSVDSVIVYGEEMEAGEDYTVNLVTGIVAFTEKPPLGVNNVIITWTKVLEGDREKITNNRYFGGVYYARMWLFGNPNHKNTRYVSGVTMAGVSDPEYWPKYTDSDVGEYEISDIVIQYNKQLIFTTGNDSEASAWYSEQETFTDPSTGLVTTLFPVYPMNTKIGNLAKGQTQVIYNNPFTVWKGIYEWVSTNVLNEKNAQWISRKIQNDLDKVDLTKAVTADWSDRGLYLLCVGKTVWVLNYRVNAWYVLKFPHTPTCFVIADAGLYFGTEEGKVMRFDDNVKTFDGELINAVWKMGYYNFGIDWLQKFIQRIFISILPRIKTHVDITYQTDRDGSSDVLTAEYRLTNFDHLDFNNFSFKTNYGPQPFKFKIRAKKMDYFKIILTNDGDDTATVLTITLPVRSGPEIKRR